MVKLLRYAMAGRAPQVLSGVHGYVMNAGTKAHGSRRAPGSEPQFGGGAHRSHERGSWLVEVAEEVTASAETGLLVLPITRVARL